MCTLTYIILHINYTSVFSGFVQSSLHGKMTEWKACEWSERSVGVCCNQRVARPHGQLNQSSWLTVLTPPKPEHPFEVLLIVTSNDSGSWHPRCDARMLLLLPNLSRLFLGAFRVMPQACPIKSTHISLALLSLQDVIGIMSSFAAPQCGTKKAMSRPSQNHSAWDVMSLLGPGGVGVGGGQTRPLVDFRAPLCHSGLKTYGKILLKSPKEGFFQLPAQLLSPVGPSN